MTTYDAWLRRQIGVTLKQANAAQHRAAKEFQWITIWLDRNYPDLAVYYQWASAASYRFARERMERVERLRKELTQ